MSGHFKEMSVTALVDPGVRSEIAKDVHWISPLPKVLMIASRLLQMVYRRPDKWLL